jgi:hypothetical protein
MQRPAEVAYKAPLNWMAVIFALAVLMLCGGALFAALYWAERRAI